METIVTEPLVRLTSSDLQVDKAGWIRRLIDFDRLQGDLLKLKLDNKYDDWFTVVFEIGKISTNDQLVNLIPQLVATEEKINGEIIMELFEYDLGRFSKILFDFFLRKPWSDNFLDCDWLKINIS